MSLLIKNQAFLGFDTNIFTIFDETHYLKKC